MAALAHRKFLVPELWEEDPCNTSVPLYVVLLTTIVKPGNFAPGVPMKSVTSFSIKNWALMLARPRE